MCRDELIGAELCKTIGVEHQIPRDTELRGFNESRTRGEVSSYLAYGDEHIKLSKEDCE